MLPTGFTDYVVLGKAVVGFDGRFFTLRLTEEVPAASLTLYNFAPAAPTEEPAAVATLAPQNTPVPAGGRPAHVHRGTCDDLGGGPRYDQTDLTVPDAPAEGAAEATVAEASYSVIAVSLG